MPATIGNNTCGCNAHATVPAARRHPGSLDRQRDKIVNAINTLDADIVSLEEIENSMKFGETDRDDAVAYLVDRPERRCGRHLEVRPLAGRRRPPDVAEQDVIRPAFIYKPAKVQPVGVSDILFGDRVRQRPRAARPGLQAHGCASTPTRSA